MLLYLWYRNSYTRCWVTMKRHTVPITKFSIGTKIWRIQVKDMLTNRNIEAAYRTSHEIFRGQWYVDMTDASQGHADKSQHRSVISSSHEIFRGQWYMDMTDASQWHVDKSQQRGSITASHEIFRGQWYVDMTDASQGHVDKSQHRSVIPSSHEIFRSQWYVNMTDAN